MKKFLSLVLALAMTMSLVTVSAGAKDFADADDITYVEAVEVMSEIGVVDGDTAGNFNPTAGLTRGAAAKIICNLILGPTTAAALNADANPYVDVDKNSTFAGFIAFCAKENIISGYADGTFKPAAPLTGYAFMKMLLGALGYDAAVENYTGSNWSINVAKRALNIGLDDGLVDTFNGSDYVTREEAMLFAFNALQADMVEYDSKTTVSVGGADVVIAGSKAEVVANTGKTDGNIGGSKDGVMQFAEKYFTNLKEVPTSDVFARPATTWKLKTTEIGTYTDTADATYTTTVKMGTIYTDLGLSKGVAKSVIDVFEDGVDTTTADLGHTAWDYDIAKGSRNEIGGNGDLIEVFYDEDDNTAIITVIHTYSGDVTSVYAATSVKDAYVTVTGDNGAVGGNYETEGFAIDDVVLYNYSRQTGEGIKNLALAETITGTMTGYTVEKSVTVDGTTYKANSTDAASVTDDKLGSYKTYEVTLVMDELGYVLDIDTDSAASNYAVVLEWTTRAGTFGGDKIAKLLFTDGTVKEVNVTNTGLTDSTNAGNIGKNDIVRFAVNSKDEYTLTLLADARSQTSNAAGEIIINGQSKISLYSGKGTSDSAGSYGQAEAKYANGKTTFLVATKSGSDTVYTAYTGIKNVPSVKVTAGVPVAVYCKTDAVATVIYIDATANATVSNGNEDVVFIKTTGTVKASYDSTMGIYYVYTAIVNGVVDESFKVKAMSNAGGTYGELYTTVTYDEYGIATLDGKAVKSAYADILSVEAGIGTKTVRAANDVIGLGANFYGYTKACKVFFIDADGEINTSSIAAISDDPDDKVFFTLDDGEVNNLFVVQQGVTADDVDGDDGVDAVPVLNNTGLDTTATEIWVKNQADGLYQLKEKYNDMNGNADDNLVVKFNTTIASETVTLTITNSAGVPVYLESDSFTAAGPHFFYFQVTGASLANAGSGTMKTTALTSGTYTVTVATVAGSSSYAFVIE